MVILIAGNLAFLLIESAKTATVLLTCFERPTFLQNLVLK